MDSTSLNITASIVLHNEDFEQLKTTVQSFLAIPESKRLFLIDNGSNSNFEEAFSDPAIIYLRNERNVGFARAHNQILSKVKGLSQFHLILNPDIRFTSEVINQLIAQMKANPSIGLSAPRVLYPSGELQYTARRYPTLFEVVYRRLGWFSKRIHRNEYRDQDLTQTFNPDFLHGCFLLFKTDDFVRINGFDERYFLYMEDVDICRKLDEIEKKKLYYPHVEVTHIFKKASAKKLPLLVIHLSSAIKYFKKWGFV